MSTKGALRVVDLRGIKYTGDSVGGVVELEEILKEQWVEYQSTPESVLVEPHWAFTAACIMANDTYRIRPIQSDSTPMISLYHSKYGFIAIKCTSLNCSECQGRSKVA